jgi:septum formation protein
MIIGADTIVVVNDRILGKPDSEDHARAMLRSLSGRWHEVITGLCLIDNRTGRSVSAHNRSRVHMGRFTRADIDWYVSTGEHHDKAGAYAIQGNASLFIDRIEGCYFNIVGFPIFTFARLCKRLCEKGFL